MKKNIASFILLLFTFQLALAQEAVLDNKDCINQVKSLQVNGKLLKAHQLMKDCALTNSDNIDLLALEAGLVYSLGDYSSTKTICNQLLEIENSNEKALEYLAKVYEQEENYPKAIKYASWLLKVDSVSTGNWKRNARLCLKAGLVKEAKYYFENAIKLNPRDITAIKSQVEILMAEDSLDNAKLLLDQAFELDSMNVGMSLLNAKWYYKNKDYGLASELLHNLSRRIDLNPYYGKMLGFASIQIDSIDRAIFYLNKALTNDKNPENLHYYLAIAYEKKEDIESAIHHYENAIKAGISDQLDVYHKDLALIFQKEKKQRKVIEHYKEAYRYSKEPVLLYLLATVCDSYYKDKSIAVNYYSKYLNTNDGTDMYKSYALERIKYLREIAHLSKD